MKKIIRILSCAGNLIKKIFSNKAKNDISHNCEKVLGIVDFNEADDFKSNIEEYEDQYNSTTRWQTV
ncbi:MAG: hypothetical protein HN778_18960 [Prolixibacteraceae bacterium]|jgi:hypothetical protein|nr:hypothetical protein [Prolixibacteraceae bacterium]MBT6004198.1 hypothetical protein [Prolixibacteraceae bacterium]MBT6763363.1 hypothetical protein [Prolixibacteraceae bacterium]MBT6997029.1 hypothetical protein [Prolixibacteraceae bacterium]MBT7396917.1 hypothetical protein [Prolixibacteraceae bacterium]